MLPSADFESAASTNSTIPACRSRLMPQCLLTVKWRMVPCPLFPREPRFPKHSRLSPCVMPDSLTQQLCFRSPFSITMRHHMFQSLGAKTFILPTPVFLVGTYDHTGRPNIMTAAWGGICASQPPSIAVSIRKSRWTYNAQVLHHQHSFPQTRRAIRFRRDAFRARYRQVHGPESYPRSRRTCGRTRPSPNVPLLLS